jgi:hypothetical protein
MSKLILTFTHQSDRVLVQLADAAHREPAELILDALSVYSWHAREQSAGTTILTMRRGGTGLAGWAGCICPRSGRRAAAAGASRIRRP